MTVRKAADPRDERIAALEKQVAELVGAIVKLAQERPVYVPCPLPHYAPTLAIPSIPYYQPGTVTPNVTAPAPYTVWTSVSGALSGGGDIIWYDRGIGVSGMISEPFCQPLA